MNQFERLIQNARKIADVGRYPMRESTENPASEHLINGSKFWRNAIKGGDNLLEAVQDVIAAMERVNESEGQRQRGHLVDVRNAVARVKQTSGEFYGDFKNGREELYATAKMWNLSTTRKGRSAPKSKPLAGVEDKALLDNMTKGADNLTTSMGKMLEAGARAANAMKSCAQKGTGSESAECKDVLEMGLDFRDLVSEAVFARVQGIMRRATELMNRFDAVAEEALFEATEWVAPWERDPEIGSGELI